MTERELRRTAVIIPPKGRAVLCVWAAVPGLLAAPFVFWQGILPGLVFAALWAVLVFLARCRACSFAAVLGASTLTVYSGIVLPVRQVFPRRAVTGVQQLRTPLLRLAGASVLIISAPGSRMGRWPTHWRRSCYDNARPAAQLSNRRKALPPVCSPALSAQNAGGLPHPPRQRAV